MIGHRTLLVTLAFVSSLPAQEATPVGTTGEVLEAIGRLEAVSDPKCHATASRLEDFIYGTPLTGEARVRKNEYLIGFLEGIWSAASRNAGQAVDAGAIGKATAARVKIGTSEDGTWEITFAHGEKRTVSARDRRQYGSVAYSLRPLLAIQQRRTWEGAPLPRLDEAALAQLKEAGDLIALALLQTADHLARREGNRVVSGGNIEDAWSRLLPDQEAPTPPASTTPPAAPVVGHPLLGDIIAQKRASYEKYNHIANQLFIRNMQVYFARLTWPTDPGEAKAFQQAFTETVIAFAADLYRTSAEEMRRRKSGVVGEADVTAAGRRFLPHTLNEYEDVVFFPKLGPGERVIIEAYDCDAFRDSGIHWHYLGNALDDLAESALPDADPFAAELLAEYIAQFGVLVLRMAGNEGLRLDRERLSVELLGTGVQRIQELIEANVNRPASLPEPPPVASAPEAASPKSDAPFTEVTAEAGVVFEHRSSDWLSRLMRGYLLRKDKEPGIVTVPPAFGGSGIAAGDLNGDGIEDLLLLGGLGNRLYLGRADGRFADATEASGLSFLRPEDRAPGEPRQPLIADFDNDGHQDIFISYVDDDHRLYRGNGDGTFVDVTAKAGLGGKGLVGGPATTFDYDGDGRLDIYIAYFGDYIHGVLPTLKRRNDNGLPNKLFRNRGGMEFSDVTAEAGVGDTGWGQAVTHTDFDGDGRQDLVVGNDFGVNVYYRNNGRSSLHGPVTFTDVSEEIGTGKPSYTMNISTADLNGDLLPDFYISNIVTMNKDEKYVLPNEDTRMKFDLAKLAHLRVVEANDLFLSDRSEAGRPVWSLSTVVERGYSSTGWAWGADFFDADLDGDDDLYVLNGMNEFNVYSSRNPYFMDPKEMEAKTVFLPVSPKEANVFFENEGGRLRIPKQPTALAFLGNSRSAAYLDWDHDGDLDIAVNNFSEPARLFRNNAPSEGRNWLALKFTGKPELGVNRDAIGTRVIIRLPDGRQIWREIHGSSGYMSVQSKQIHTGLGTATEAEVEITWPNGTRQVIPSLPANRIHEIRLE